MKQTAQGLASLGRGPDTELVHMAPSEVAGLQQLAQAHGGSLTINPHTGLPEAGFLSSILPTVIGGALMATGVGSPLGVAMMVGAGYTAATGSLKSGLMAGLGAYGGAGLGAGIMDAGASAAYLAAFDGAQKIFLFGFDGSDGVTSENIYADTFGYESAEYMEDFQKFNAFLYNICYSYSSTQFYRVRTQHSNDFDPILKTLNNYREVSVRDAILLGDF